MSQLEQRQLLRRQEETIQQQNIILFRNAEKIEYLENELEGAAKTPTLSIEGLSFSADACMFASGAAAVHIIEGILNRDIAQTIAYLVTAAVMALFSIAIRNARWA